MLRVRFRPDFIGTYTANLEALYDTGEAPEEVALLSRLRPIPTRWERPRFKRAWRQPRRWATIMTGHVVLDEMFQCRVASEIAAAIAILTTMEAESFT